MSYNSKYKGAEVEELLDSIGNKVDKVDGKQLSTEDFTTLLKQKLEGLSNYDDTAIQESVSKLRTDLDTLVSGDSTTAIKTFNEIIAFLDGISDTEDLASIIASIEQQIAAKYTKPSTGIPKSDLASAVQTSLGKADTALQSYTEQYQGTVTGVKMNGTTKNPSNGVVDLGTVITAHQDLSNYQPKLVSGTNIKTINGESILGEGDITIEGGSDVTVPTKLSELENDLGFVGKESTGYSFDDAVGVKGSVSARDGFVGTFRGNGSGQLDIDDNGNITTRNSNDDRALEITTSGNGTKFLSNDGTYKTISGGGSTSGSSAYPLVGHGTSDTTFTLTPNTFHVWDEVASLDLSLGAETSGVANEYLFQFTSGSTATTLTLPSDIKWANDTAPTIAADMIYQVSILKGLACVLEFSNAVALIENKASSSGRVITFDYPVASDLTISYSYRGSSYQVSIAAGEQSVTAGDTIHSIDSITPSSDGTYNYTFDIS